MLKENLLKRKMLILPSEYEHIVSVDPFEHEGVKYPAGTPMIMLFPNGIMIEEGGDGPIAFDPTEFMSMQENQ